MSKRGFVDHNQYETVSILSFIEGLFNLPPLNTRDAMALPPVAAFIGQPDLFVEAKVGQSVSYQVPAYSNPVSYNLLGNLDGLEVNSNTGIITGAPKKTGKFQALVTVNGAPAAVLPGQNNRIEYLLELDVN